MESLRRKLNNRAEMRFAAAAARNTQALGRTTQAAHSTIAVGDADIPLVETVEESRDTAADLPAVAAEAEVAADDAYEAAINVDEAHAAADQAVADALKAQQTADGKNTIYRQPINPVAVPEKPFVNGDVWYRTIEVSGVTQIADVNMWNGTEWKLYQQIASSVLVPGSVGNVLIQDGAIDAKKMTVDALYGKVLRGNEIYGALIDGSKFRLSGLTNASTIVNDSGSSLTSWAGLSGTTLALDTGVFETGTRSIRGTRILGNDFGVSRQFPLVLSALTAWFRVRVASETIFTASIIRFNNVLGVYEPGAVSTPLVVPANTWTWVSVSGNSLSGGMSWRSATLSAAAPQPTNVWIDRFQLVAGVEDQRSVEIARSSNGVPAIYGFGSTRQQRFTLDTGALDAAAGAAYGSLTLGTDDQERTGQYTPFGMRWGNKSGGALHGFVHQDDSYDGDLTLSAQGKSVRLLSKLDATVGVKAARWSAPWNDNKTAGFWYGSAAYVGDPPGSGWVLMTITKHEDQGLVIQEARRSLTPTMKVSRIWDGTTWSAWQSDTSPSDTEWANATLAPGVTGIARWRRFWGSTFLEFSITSASVAADGLLNPAFTIPPSQVPEAGAPINVNGGGTRPAIGRMSPADGGAIFRNTWTGAQTQFVGGGNWLST